MAAINPLGRELVLKIVFYGPGLGGKTTTLQHLHDSAKPEHRGKMVSLATEVDRTLYFDYLPLRVPKTRGMSVRLQLFTVPGQVHYNSTRKLVLTGADGVVFVADSQGARADANLESLDNLEENLREQGRELSALPHVMQYNKRDLEEAMPRHELEKLLNRYGAKSVPTIARTGEGVYEVLTHITQASLAAFQASLPTTNEPPDIAFGEPERAMEDALRREQSEQPAPKHHPLVVDENVIEARALETRHVEVGGHTVPGIPQSSPLSPPLVPSEARPSTNRSPTRSTKGASFSLVSIWSEEERGTAEAVERLIATGSLDLAAEPLEALCQAVMRLASEITSEPSTPAVVPLATEHSRRAWWVTLQTIRRARHGRATLAELSTAYATLCTVRAALTDLS